MTEILTALPIELQEPESPNISALSRREVAELNQDLASQAAVFGWERAMARLQEPVGEHIEGSISIQTRWKTLKDQVLIDLGCGTGEKGVFRRTMCANKIKAYVGVDLFPAERPGPVMETPIGPASVLDDKGTGIPRIIVKGDMLDMVSRLPDESCSFSMNGVGEHIVNPRGDYGMELSRQIDRATRIGGFVIGTADSYGILSEFESSRAYRPVYEWNGSKKYRFETYRKVS